MQRLRVFLFLALAMAGMLVPAAYGQKVKDPVKITATAIPSPVRPGEFLTVTVTATIAPGYHIYSAVPTKEPGPLATTLTVTGTNLEISGTVSESAPVVKQDKNFQMEVGSHEGTATFRQAAKVTATAAGTLAATASLRFQACDATSCLPPKTVTAEVTLPVEAGTVRPEYAQPAAPPSIPAASESGTALPIRSNAGSGGLLGFLAAAFGAGLLALITPCVFPMIPVTFAYFTKQATTSNTSIVKLASIYSLGIIAAFTAIGAILAVIVGPTGAARLAANPWTNLVFAVLFIVFGLALLELFELKLPDSLQNLSSKGRQQGGTLGVLVMGLTFVIAAFTCTAPFIGTVLVAASTAQTGADWIRPILGMATFATALALPFFLLALFPGLLARLPKSGDWLTTIKGTMGFLEIGAAIKFLSNSDLVWQWQIITKEVMLALWVIIALGAGLWLLGILRVGFNTPDGRPSLGRGVGAALFFAAAIYFMIGLTGRPLESNLNAFLPPPEYRYTSGNAQKVAHADDLQWHEDIDAALAEAKAQNKPVFVDFSGYTCGNCRWMEQNIFVRPEVRAELGKFVRVRLMTDDPKHGVKWQEYQEKNFGDVSLPLYGVLTPQGDIVKGGDGTAARQGYDPDPAVFTGFLKATHSQAGSVQTATVN